MPFTKRRRIIIRALVAAWDDFFAFGRAVCSLGEPHEQGESPTRGAGDGNIHRRRFVGLSRFLCVVLLLTGFFAPLQARNLIVLPPYSLTLAWDPSPDGGVGYRVYYGTASRNYSFTNDVGGAAVVTISGLTRGVTYFLAVTAYDANGVESDFSEELSYARAIPSVQIRTLPGSGPVLTLAGPPGHTNEVLATQTFLDWAVIGVVTFGVDGFAELVDYGAAGHLVRFYRTREIEPW